MSDEQPSKPTVERPGPSDMSSKLVREEARKAAVWLGMALSIVVVVLLAQPILLIIRGMVFAIILDGGTRLLGRVLPIGRGWRLAIITIAGFGFIGWTFYFAGTTFAEQAGTLRVVVTEQANKLLAYVDSAGLLPEGGLSNIGGQLLGGVGRLTTAPSPNRGAMQSGRCPRRGSSCQRGAPRSVRPKHG